MNGNGQLKNCEVVGVLSREIEIKESKDLVKEKFIFSKMFYLIVLYKIINQLRKPSCDGKLSPDYRFCLALYCGS